MWALIVDRLRSYAALRRDIDKVGALSQLERELSRSGDVLPGQHEHGPGAVDASLPGAPPESRGQHAAANIPSHPAGLRATLVREFLAERTGDRDLDRDILGHCALRLGRELDEHRATIAVLAAVAPLLGLLGTVLGMIETFDVIALFGTGNSRALASGISVALITTQTGLLVAIPGLLMSNRLGRAAEQLHTGLEETHAALERCLAPKEKTA
ncbi:MotA/TolQ/ExbB proton channel family protein [bacterium]|nr:MotA/TolQ/ExbB proton channel family protein [bacterium]